MAPGAKREWLGVVILGAGASVRMRRPKLLLPWGDTSVLGHLINQWRELCPAQITVVHPGASSPPGRELDRLGFPPEHAIANPDPARGMFSSIQCAAGWGGWGLGLTHWAVVLGDQPHLRLQTLARLVDFVRANHEAVCQPSRHGRARHPVVMPRSIWRLVAGAVEPNLKVFLQNHSGAVKLCEMDDPGLDVDLDSPADYERVWTECFGTKPS